MISFGKNFPLYGLLYDHLPLFNKFRVPVMIIVLFQVAAALGLAWGWSAVLERRDAKPDSDRRIDRLLLAAGALLLLAVVVGVAGQSAWRGSYVATAVAHRSTPNQPFAPEAAQAAFQGFVGDLSRVGM